MEEKSFLSVKNLAVQYTSDDKIIYAVNNVSFDLEKGTDFGTGRRNRCWKNYNCKNNSSDFTGYVI